jgi:hypothetical protein
VFFIFPDMPGRTESCCLNEEAKTLANKRLQEEAVHGSIQNNHQANTQILALLYYCAPSCGFLQ